MSDLVSSILLNAVSSTPEIASLKLRIALPNVCPRPGSLRGPKIRRTMARINRCPPEIPIIMAVLCTLAIVVSMVDISALGIIDQANADEIKPHGTNAYQKVTGDDSEDDRRRWNVLFNTNTYVFGKEPASFLKDNVNLLPVGRVLDIAMGEGRNAVFLAKKGFVVDGVDISEIALRKAKRLARENHVSINTICADLNSYAIKAEAYDVIVNINYLQRSLIPQIKKGLKKGGVIVYENYTVDQLKNTHGQQIRRDFLLSKGELREFFKDFEIFYYQEVNDGKEAVARLLGRK